MRTVAKLMLAALLAGYAPLGLCMNYMTSRVLVIQPPQWNSDCLFFKLVGVSEADPILTGNPWFAVPRAHPGFQETFAILLAAQKAGTTVWVRTTGQIAGGACAQNVITDFVISNAD